MEAIGETCSCNSRDSEITTEIDINTKIRKKSARVWGWNKKRPDTPLVDKTLKLEWKQSRSSNSDCKDPKCPMSANILNDEFFEDKPIINHVENINKGPLSVLTISDDKSSKSITENRSFKNIRNLRWCKKRGDTPMINEEKRFNWFRVSSSDTYSSDASIPNSENDLNQEEPMKNSPQENPHLIMNSKGVFLKPLVTRFPNRASRKHRENKEVANSFEI